MIGFQLGREYKLSIAEILAIFPQGKIVFLSNDFLILDSIDEELVLSKADNLGGTIKIVKICKSSFELEWVSEITSIALNYDGKFKYGISIFGDKKNLKKILINQKKELKQKNISSRFVNKDFKNLSSAQIIGEKLIAKGTDFNYIYSDDNIYCGKSIWIQDIASYSKRDYSKDRDMQIGMLPPKLCQMMINISGGKNIYDPFVGLGTMLIESILMGNDKVYGSDLNSRMVDTSINNINSLIKTNSKLDKTKFKVFKLNSKFINESDVLLNKKVDSIVTEGYLGEVMTKKNISIDRIDKQKISLIDIYSKFFEGLQNINYKGNLVICFPFWEIKGKYIYFDDIYEIINIYCSIEPMLIDNIDVKSTKLGSLLYKRPKQLVGREIFKLKIKKV